MTIISCIISWWVAKYLHAKIKGFQYKKPAASSLLLIISMSVLGLISSSGVVFGVLVLKTVNNPELNYSNTYFMFYSFIVWCLFLVSRYFVDEN